MKNFHPFILLFSLMLITINTNAQWTQINSPTQNNLNCVQIIDSSIIYIGGDGGKVYKTLDGGENWFDVSPQSSKDWFCMNFVDSNNGWVAGRGGSVARTTNGGSSWEINSVYNVSNLNVIEAMYFYDQNTGYITGGMYTDFDRQAYVYKTTDGGQTWNQQIQINGGVFLAMSFVDQNTGYVVGTSGGVYKTTDGGVTWVPFFVNTGNWLRSVYFFDSQEGLALGQGGLGWKTFDGGNSWNSVNTSTSDWIEYVSFKDKLNGWAVGGNGLCIQTTDGGNSWIKSQLPTSNYLWGVDIRDSTGMIVGNNGTILKYFENPIKITSPNGDENWLIGTTEQIEWTSSDVSNFKIEYSTDNGLSWITIESLYPSSSGAYSWQIPSYPTTQCLIKLSDANDLNVYDISDGTFSLVTPTPFWQFSGLGGENVAVIEGDLLGNVYAGSYQTGLYRLTDNGGNWSLVNTGSSGGVRAIKVNPAGEIFVSYEDKLRFSTDNGSSWQLSSTIYNNINHIESRSSGFVIVGHGGGD